MVSGLPGLLKLNKEHVKAAAAMLSDAFKEYPLTLWFRSELTGRIDNQTRGFETMLRFGVAYGEVYATSPSMEGAAFWVHSEKSDMTPWRNVRCGNYSILFRSRRKMSPRLRSYSEYATAVHRRCAPFPHLYLRLLGVAPSQRGRGLAGRLLRPMFERIDRYGLPCFLETQAERNVAIYEHLGFKVVEAGMIPGSDVMSWGMLRKIS